MNKVQNTDVTVDDGDEQHRVITDRLIGWILTIGGLTGALAAFVLTVEKIALLKNPAYVPSCSINPILSFGSIMTTQQAEVFGFANPLIGLATFPVVAATGVAVLARARLPRWWWLALHAGTLFGVVFVHWLFVQSLYRIGALCPYRCCPSRSNSAGATGGWHKSRPRRPLGTQHVRRIDREPATQHPRADTGTGRTRSSEPGCELRREY